MGYGRSNEEGFRGEYPPPLDWEKIQRELLERADEVSDDEEQK